MTSHFNRRNDKMKTKEDIEKRLEWCIKALDDEDNSQELAQTKLWQWIDALRWVLEIK